MKFDHVGLADKEITFAEIRHVAENLGFVHAEQWDYERAMFDHKMVIQDATYYLRIPVFATQGEIPKNDTIVKMMDPILGRHYYPHGVEYDDETFPQPIIDKCNAKLEQLKEIIEKDN